MTRKKRMLTAMTGGIPDRVPASPDTNWTIPARLAGGPFWKIFREGNPPIWKAYNDCVRYFGVDGFSHHGTYQIPPHPDTERENETILQSDEKIITRNTFKCPLGELTKETTFLRGEPPTATKKPITDFEKQYDFLEYLCFGDIKNIKFDKYKEIQADMGDDGVVGLCMNLPTLLTHIRQPVEGAFYDYFEHHDLLTAFIERWTDYLVEIAHAIVDQNVKPDFIFFPNSGMITMQSEDIMREYSIPALKKLVPIFKKAGIVTSLHCCGKEHAVVEIAATETDLDCIDPLEEPPMGDCVLKEIKEQFGGKIALKGNLHTSKVMLEMDPTGIEKAAIKCLDDAMEGGGFILSTGDQCGRDTPEENIFRLVEVCEKYGKY